MIVRVYQRPGKLFADACVDERERSADGSVMVLRGNAHKVKKTVGQLSAICSRNFSTFCDKQKHRPNGLVTIQSRFVPLEHLWDDLTERYGRRQNPLTTHIQLINTLMDKCNNIRNACSKCIDNL